MSSRILLVEDNPDDEALALRALSKCEVPVEVQVARDGVEALEALGLEADAKPAAKDLPNLVLLDIKLPKVSGLEVLRKIRRTPQTEGLSVVMLTSSDEPTDVISASLLNVSKYVRKPVDYVEFMASLRNVVREFFPELSRERATES